MSGLWGNILRVGDLSSILGLANMASNRRMGFKVGEGRRVLF